MKILGMIGRLGLLLVAAAHAAPKASGVVWVGTWAAAPQGVANSNGGMGGADMTLRQVVHVSLGGSAIRLKLSNEFGTEPLRIAAAAVEMGGEAGVRAMFDGRAEVTIPPGTFYLSDPVALRVPALADLTVDLFVPAQPLKTITLHGESLRQNYMAPGDQVGAKTLDRAKQFAKWYILKGIDVQAAAGSAAIVTLGDSITDGDKSTMGTNSRWPDVLARRLQGDKRTAGIGVLNEGISGNRLLRDLGGVSALARFDRDVLGQAGVKYLIILEGINDIGHVDRPAFAGDALTAGELSGALAQMIERAHARGILVYGATLTPYPGVAPSAEKIVALEHAENDWIRTSGAFDGVIDLERLTRDPSNPGTMLPLYDSGDHLHPGDAGYKAMGEGIDLRLFLK